MLGLDAGVWTALLLSVASLVLCLAYGLVRWNADDDALGDTSVPDGGVERSAQEDGENR